ncbi:uncharacterized protein LOC143246035 [Tachypleus tridentatus]|uniref:uncharacterized protein LOC143246035 n=1 Tax=Tachypleus tridentatus TaxID=6853 RepID=UPI003FD5061C
MPPKHDRRQKGAESRSTNFVGKFTTSVRKLVQEVECGDHTREGAIQTNERLRNVTSKVSESYCKVKLFLITLHEKYDASKSERNIFRRYGLFKSMIKEVIPLDAQYWRLVTIPKQDKHEQVTTYVLRACAALEKITEARPAEGAKTLSSKHAEDEARDREKKARFDEMSVEAIENENQQLINDLYRLLKKYTSLRNIVHELNLAYRDARLYPIIPRYTMLKEMIKDVLRDPNYMEVCHEDVGKNL